MNTVELVSGCKIPEAEHRLLSFCAGEYAYYDGIASGEPDRIEPIDVLVTVAVNSFVNSAARVYRVHQGLRDNCEPLLSAIPVDADLLDLDSWRDPLHDLLHAAVQASSVLIPVATKVLHRKRRRLIPMLDNVVLHYYFRRPDQQSLLAASQSKTKAADVAMQALDLFQADLIGAHAEVQQLARVATGRGFPLSDVRVLEILLWTEIEPRAGYRPRASEPRC
jgi:hypothetical protein